MRKIATLLLLLVFACCRYSNAITNGTLDGNRHPNVGTIVFEITPGEKTWGSTGTLISPTVFLCAGHSLLFLQNILGVSQVWVSFDPVDPPTGTLHSGTMHVNPGITPGIVPGVPDLGVIVLDEPVVGITPAALPSAGMLDRRENLRNELFTTVGYGATDTVFGGGPPQYPNRPGQRRYAIEGFYSLLPTTLYLSSNPELGFGGGSFGDSGAPNFLGAGDSETSIITSVAWGGDPQSLNLIQAARLDTAEAREFLGQYVILP
jgi:hypothetical protein